uniref:G-protein coupled receptors family 1 profile domain-containing protein n=1 Tax=Sinocyclocheilus rhinocerous TaxID=307959 RepID=A0A673JVR2_9TELE
PQNTIFITPKLYINGSSFCSFFITFTNQTLFEGNLSAVAYNDQTIKYLEPLNSIQFLKGLVVTHVMPSIYIFIIISLPLNGLAMKAPVIYMSQLACVDLLFTLLLPLKIHYQLNASNWVFGEAACRVLSAAYYGNMYCSVLLMMCMSVDRLLAVAFPISSLTWRSSRKATCVCVVVWLLTLAGMVPLLMMNQTTAFEGGITCFDILADSSVRLYLSVFLILLCIYFILPLIVILVSYSIIIHVLCAKHDHSSSSSDNRRRAAIMFTAVLTEFVVCFAPSNGLLIYHCICLQNGATGWDTYPPYMIAVCLGSSSVFMDPLLYYYGSSHYRHYRTMKHNHTKSSHLSCTVKQTNSLNKKHILLCSK